MGLFELLGIVLLVVLLVGAAVWAIGYLMPDHPPIIDRGLWFLAVLIIAVVVWRALGGQDVRIPKVF